MLRFLNWELRRWKPKEEEPHFQTPVIHQTQMTKSTFEADLIRLEEVEAAIKEEERVFDAAMKRIGEESNGLPEDSPQHMVLAAECEVWVSRLKARYDRLDDWVFFGR